jgi:hypothetical protein
MRRLSLLLSVGWVPPDWRPSGACLCLGSRVLSQPPNAAEGDTTPGRRLFPCPEAAFGVMGDGARGFLVLRWDRDLLGHGPDDSHQRTRHGDRDHVSMCAACAAASVALAQAHLGVPAHVLDALGRCFQPPLQVSPDFGWVAGRPGACHARAPGLGVAGCGDRALATPLPRGLFRGEEAQEFHECSGGIKAGEVATFGHGGDGHGTLPPPQGLQRVDHRVETPGVDLLVECVLQPLETFGVRIDRPDVFPEDGLVRRGGPDDLREPPATGRAPRGPARLAASVSEHGGVESKLGGLEIAEGLVTGAGEVADRVVFHCGDIDGGEIPRAREAGQWHGVTAVGCDAIAGFFGNQRGCHHPAVVAFFGQIPIEPIATGAGFIDKDQMLGLGWQLADEVVNVILACADGTEVADLGAVISRDVSDGNRVLTDVHSDIERARLCHG